MELLKACFAVWAAAVLSLCAMTCDALTCPAACSQCDATVLGCSTAGLTVAPSPLPATLTSVSIDGNQLQYLPSGFFDHTTSLINVSLWNNKFTEYAPGLFDNTPLMKSLWLGNNMAVTGLPAGFFDYMPLLDNLNLGSMNLQLNQSVCAIANVLQRGYTPTGSALLFNQIQQARTAMPCTASTTLCYSFPGKAEHFFCDCGSAQIYDGTSCVYRTDRCSFTPGVGTVCAESPACYRGVNLTYICQCRFGRELIGSHCHRSRLRLMDKTNVSATVMLQTSSLAFNGSAYALTYDLVVKTTYPISAQQVIRRPMNRRTLTVPSLSPGYIYQISVPNSQFLPIAVITDQDVPDSPVINVTATFTTIKVTIESLPSSSWTVARYCVALDRTVRSICFPPPQTSVEFLHLSFGTRYVVSAYAVNTGNQSSSVTLDEATIMASASGGHTMEMVALLPRLQADRRVFVVATTDPMSRKKVDSKPSDVFVTIPRAREVRQSWFSSVWTSLVALLYAVFIVFRHRPTQLLCNGPGTCVPLCIAAFVSHVIGWQSCHIVYIESVCRVNSLSLSAKILNLLPFADILVQWPQLKTKYPNCVYLGRLS